MSEAALVPVSEATAAAWLHLKTLALHGIESAHTRRAYDHALTGFYAWYRAGEHGAFSKFVVEAYRMHLAERGLAAQQLGHGAVDQVEQATHDEHQRGELDVALVDRPHERRQREEA